MCVCSFLGSSMAVQSADLDDLVSAKSMTALCVRVASGRESFSPRGSMCVVSVITFYISEYLGCSSLA